MMTLPSRILWVDDRIGNYGPWITKFREYGTEVDPTSTIAEGLIKLDEYEYDVVLLDLMMEHESCMDMLSIVQEKAKRANLFVCSGFLYLPDVIRQLGVQREGRVRFGQIDKTNLPFTDDEDATRQFLRDLNSTDVSPEGDRSESATLIAKATSHELAGPEKNREFPTWAEYSELDARAKMEVLRAAAELTRDTRKKFEEAGYQYLLFCGSWTQPILKLESLDAVPTQEEIVGKARVVGFAPFVFSTGGRIDDCSEKNGLRGYPVLRITQRGSTEEVHFDSGNPYSLLSYEWYTQKGWFTVSFSFDVYQAGEMELIGNHFTLKNAIVTDAAGRTETVDLKGFAVVDWNATRLATECVADCINYCNRHLVGGCCKYRTGLLGRNLPRMIGKHWRFDFGSGKVYFPER